MYLQWSKIDVGAPEFREANRLFLYFGKLVKQIKDVMGMCYFKEQTIRLFFLCPSAEQLT